MKRYLMAAMTSVLLLSPSAMSKPVPSKQTGMAGGVRAVFDAASKKDTVYGTLIPLSFTKDDVGKMLEIVVDSPKPVTIELWAGEIARGATTWDKGRKFLGNSGGAPERKPSFKWMVDSGTFTALILTTLPPGTKPDVFMISYGKELRIPTVKDKAEWDTATAKYTISSILQAQAKRSYAPNFSTIATDRNPISPQQYRGKVLLIEFTAGSEQVTMEEIGFNWTTYQLYKDQGYEVISIYLDTEQAAFDAIQAMFKPGWREVFDSSTGNKAIADKYGVDSANLPDTTLIDAAGRVISQGVHREALRKQTLAAIAEAKAYKDAMKLVEDSPDTTGEEAAQPDAKTVKDAPTK